jgi:Response regulator receiver domain
MAKILLVEDNEMNRDMLSRRLIRNGHEVFIAIDGQQGTDMAMSQLPDLILMDMSLPVIDGWEATRRVKANDATRKSRSSRSPRTRWRAIARRRWKRAATTTRPSPSKSRVCLAKWRNCWAERKDSGSPIASLERVCRWLTNA